MLRQSPSRNQRAGNAFKVKHALQVFLLLAICMWVLYQVRHKEVVGDVFQDEGSEGERTKFGRKELPPPRPENIGGEEKEDEPREYFEEMEVEGRGVGDDEIDGNGQETAEEADAAGESREEFGDKEDRDYYPRDESSEAEKDRSEGEEKEDQADGILQDQRKVNVASDASSYTG